MRINLLFLLCIILFVMISCEREPSLETKFQQADELIEASLDSLFAGAILLVGNRDEILHQQAFGYANRYNERGELIANPEQMTTEHLFDLASVTKIMATTYGLMVLHDRGMLDVTEPVHKYLPEFETDDKKEITIENLLRHRSGLMQWFPSYYVADSPEERFAFTISEPLLTAPGLRRYYSDFGFMVLGDVIEQVTGQSLDEFLTETIYRPMGLTSTVFNPDTTTYSKIATTSHGNPFEKRMVYDDEFGYTVDVDPEKWDGWREYTLRGEVNDGNAFHTQKGVAGHAGLFSTAEEVYKLLRVMLNDGRYEGGELFGSDTINLFLQKDEFGHGLGWMMSNSSLHATQLPESSFGHTGFTGTNVVVNPENGRIMVFLTNRQQLGVDEEGLYPNLRQIREELSRVLLSD